MRIENFFFRLNISNASLNISYVHHHHHHRCRRLENEEEEKTKQKKIQNNFPEKQRNILLYGTSQASSGF